MKYALLIYAAEKDCELEHHGLVPDEASKHAAGWLHFLDRLRVLAGGGDPGRDAWAEQVSKT